MAGEASPREDGRARPQRDGDAGARRDSLGVARPEPSSGPPGTPTRQNVTIEGGGSDLMAGSRFRWKTFGVTLDSKVEEFVPPERLAWSAHSTGIDVYHAWLIQKRPSGCHVLTEESQNGLMARLSSMIEADNMSTIISSGWNSFSQSEDRAATRIVTPGPGPSSLRGLGVLAQPYIAVKRQTDRKSTLKCPR